MLFSIFGTESIGQTSTCNLSKSSFDGRAKRMFCIFVNAAALHAFWKGLAHFDHWCITYFTNYGRHWIILRKFRAFWLKIVKSKWGCRPEMVHFWPYVGKAKMRLKVDRWFWKIVNKELKIVNKFSKLEKIYHLSNAFWLYQQKVKSAPFQFYYHLLLTILYQNTLYTSSFKL